MESHMMMFFVMTLSRILFGLQFSIVENELGMVMRSATFISLDFKKINARAMSAPGAVTCVLTVLPSLMLLLLFSMLKFVLSMLWGGSIIFPPSMNRINRDSNSRSFIFVCCAPLPRLMSPRENPAANEYPSRSKHLSLIGFRPIYANVISVISLLPFMEEEMLFQRFH